MLEPDAAAPRAGVIRIVLEAIKAAATVTSLCATVTSVAAGVLCIIHGSFIGLIVLIPEGVHMFLQAFIVEPDTGVDDAGGDHDDEGIVESLADLTKLLTFTPLCCPARYLLWLLRGRPRVRTGASALDEVLMAVRQHPFAADAEGARDERRRRLVDALVVPFRCRVAAALAAWRRFRDPLQRNLAVHCAVQLGLPAIGHGVISFGLWRHGLPPYVAELGRAAYGLLLLAMFLHTVTWGAADGRGLVLNALWLVRSMSAATLCFMAMDATACTVELGAAGGPLVQLPFATPSVVTVTLSKARGLAFDYGRNGLLPAFFIFTWAPWAAVNALAVAGTLLMDTRHPIVGALGLGIGVIGSVVSLGAVTFGLFTAPARLVRGLYRQVVVSPKLDPATRTSGPDLAAVWLLRFIEESDGAAAPPFVADAQLPDWLPAGPDESSGERGRAIRFLFAVEWLARDGETEAGGEVAPPHRRDAAPDEAAWTEALEWAARRRDEARGNNAARRMADEIDEFRETARRAPLVAAALRRQLRTGRLAPADVVPRWRELFRHMERMRIAEHDEALGNRPFPSLNDSAAFTLIVHVSAALAALGTTAFLLYDGMTCMLRRGTLAFGLLAIHIVSLIALVLAWFLLGGPSDRSLGLALSTVLRPGARQFALTPLRIARCIGDFAEPLDRR